MSISTDHNQRFQVQSVRGGLTLVKDRRTGELLACHRRRNAPSSVCGDYVALDRRPAQTPVITNTRPRRTLLSRHMPHGKSKPIAANIGRVWVVFAPRPEASLNLVDQYLAVAEHQSLAAGLLCNKADLIDGSERDAMQGILNGYAAIGYPVFMLAAKQDQLPADFIALLHREVSIFVGQSGVGKSTLINKLLCGEDLRTGDLMASGLGRHTTSSTSLYPLNCGGSVIDSPGVRNFAVWHIPDEMLAHQFREFRPHLGACRFRDCRHRDEPGCAIKAAVASGAIGEARWRSYLNCLDT